MGGFPRTKRNPSQKAEEEKGRFIGRLFKKTTGGGVMGRIGSFAPAREAQTAFEVHPVCLAWSSKVGWLRAFMLCHTQDFTGCGPNANTRGGGSTPEYTGVSLKEFRHLLS